MSWGYKAKTIDGKIREFLDSSIKDIGIFFTFDEDTWQGQANCLLSKALSEMKHMKEKIRKLEKLKG
jgi:hypothetical protein